MAKAKKDLVPKDQDATKKKDASPKESTKKGTTDAPAKKEDGFNLVKFLAESREELKKVVWPSRQQLISESAAVILMVTLVATTIYFVDNFFLWLSNLVF